MVAKSCTVVFLASLLGSTLCHIPDGEIQIGPIFGKGVGHRFFGGNKHFEAVFEKGVHLKPILAKKVLLGAGVIGAGALAAGGAALIAKKFPHLHHGLGWGGAPAYDQGHYNNYNNAVPSYAPGNYNGYHQAPTATEVKFPSSYPASAPSYGNVNYPSTEYGYPQTEYTDSSYGNYGGWSR